MPYQSFLDPELSNIDNRFTVLLGKLNYRI